MSAHPFCRFSNFCYAVFQGFGVFSHICLCFGRRAVIERLRYTDLRRGIDGLAAIVTMQYGMELREDSLFLFCGRRTDRIKALYWSGEGYVLIYKRLCNGSFQWPRSTEELKSLDAQSFRWLMEGLKIEQPKAIRKGKQKALF